MTTYSYIHLGKRKIFTTLTQIHIINYNFYDVVYLILNDLFS